MKDILKNVKMLNKFLIFIIVMLCNVDINKKLI